MSLRRACTRLAPRVLAAVSEAASITECSVLRALPTSAPSQHAAVAGLRQFRSSSVACSSLAQTLQSEVKFEQENYSPPEELAGGPPKGFALHEEKGDTHITLSREYKGEEVTVDLMVNNQPEQEPYENEEGELEVDVGVVFNVSVTKGDKSLVFECRSDGSYCVIQHVSLEPAEGEVPESHYTGPVYAELDVELQYYIGVYAELDEELQNNFAEFLAERGINEDLGAFLLQLMHDKEQREYMHWLQNVHTFVNK
ncbi:hypothetical protein N2152v2_000178 [Parachlorella kessleri]